MMKKTQSKKVTIKELKNPSFFLPYGFYETPEDIEDALNFAPRCVVIAVKE